MKRRKLLATLLVIATATTLIAGCGSSETKEESAQTTEVEPEANAETEAEATEQAEPQVVTLLIDREPARDGLDAVIAEIEKRFNIVTEVESIPGSSEGESIRKTRLATGDMADITNFNTGSLLAGMNPAENFLDISDQPFVENLNEDFIQTASVDGKLYGVPVNSTQVGAWIYNKAIYEELGLEIPLTWDDLMENCEIIKDAGKIAVAAPFSAPGTSQLVLLSDFYNVQAEDPEFAANYSANQANFSDSPIAMRGFEKLYEIGERGFYSEDYLAATPDDVYKMMAEGTAVHYPILSSGISGIASLYPDAVEDLSIFAQPGDNADSNGITVWMPNAYYINKNSENTEAALKWVEFFASPEAVEIFAAAEKPIGPYAVKGVELPEGTPQAIKDLQVYFDEGRTAAALEFVSPVKGPNLPQICVETASNMSTAEQSAETYDQDVIKQAKQLGLEGW